jgi:hypothetical protein
MPSDRPNPHFDPDANVVRVRYGGAASVEESIAVLQALPRVIAESGCRLVLTTVVGTPDYISKKDRERIAETARESTYDKEAIVTSNPMIRMLIRAIVLVSRRAHPIHYFAREEDALQWLHEDGE